MISMLKDDKAVAAKKLWQRPCIERHDVAAHTNSKPAQAAQETSDTTGVTS